MDIFSLYLNWIGHLPLSSTIFAMILTRKAVRSQYFSRYKVLRDGKLLGSEKVSATTMPLVE